MCHCPCARWPCCVSTGAPIATLSAGSRHLLERARELLKAKRDSRHLKQSGRDLTSDIGTLTGDLRCPSCGAAMTLVGTIKARAQPP